MFTVLKQCRKSEAVSQGPMLLKRLSLIGCMSLLVLTNITAAFSDPQVNEAVESKASKQTVVEKGDIVTVTYSSKEAGGEVFESKSIKFRVGTGTTYPGIEHAVLGMKEGETKTIDVPAAEGYGEVNVKKFVDIPLQRSMPRQKNISLAAFKRSAKSEPEEGKWYTLRGLQWPVKVLKVENRQVLLDLVPEKETRIPALIGYALVSSDEKRVTTTMVTEARVGDQLTMRNGQHAKVAALDDKDITLDLNHPLAGRQVTFDFTITGLTKTPPLIIPDLKRWEDIDGIGFN
jgi:FKBP-type peptidyl-prolyl cis-trans isomerase 2